MIISGAVILAFLGLHMYDFWMHEMNYKYVEALSINETRYWEELHAKFADLWRVIFLCSFFCFIRIALITRFPIIIPIDWAETS